MSVQVFVVSDGMIGSGNGVIDMTIKLIVCIDTNDQGFVKCIQSTV
ncbi:hypothetical protein JCM19237_6625 [Photobacterium aphoticum]|uniref:Uncharacterized protein n=1 Tax=Photobacterium aphoticum TaxID=754436 RepID=A0A090QLC7_9GAMM|nr:hypothetical protein JCM19237_6625 [Photobacterium aphoticum]